MASEGLQRAADVGAVAEAAADDVEELAVVVASEDAAKHRDGIEVEDLSVEDLVVVVVEEGLDEPADAAYLRTFWMIASLNWYMRTLAASCSL